MDDSTEPGTQQGAAPETVDVKITGSPHFTYAGNVRRQTDPVTDQNRTSLPSTYPLAPGKYFYNVHITGIANATVTLTFKGAKTDLPTTWVMPGVAGQAHTLNRDVLFTVAAAAGS